MRGGDIVFISLHSFCPHVHTEHWMQAELNNLLSTQSHLTQMDTVTLTSSHPHTLIPSQPHPQTSPLSTSYTLHFTPSHILRHTSHPPISLRTPHTLPYPFSHLTPSHIPPHTSHPPISLLTPHTLPYPSSHLTPSHIPPHTSHLTIHIIISIVIVI